MKDASLPQPPSPPTPPSPHLLLQRTEIPPARHPIAMRAGCCWKCWTDAMTSQKISDRFALSSDRRNGGGVGGATWGGEGDWSGNH